MRMARRIFAASATGLMLAATMVPSTVLAATSGTGPDAAESALASQLVLLSAKVNSSSTIKAEATVVIQAVTSPTFDWNLAIFGSDSLNTEQQVLAADFIPTLKSVASFSITSQSQAVTLIENLVRGVQQVDSSIATDSVVTLLQNIESNVIFGVVPSIRQQMTKNPKMTQIQLESALEASLHQNIQAAVQSSGSAFTQLFSGKQPSSSTSGTGSSGSNGTGTGKAGGANSGSSGSSVGTAAGGSDNTGGSSSGGTSGSSTGDGGQSSSGASGTSTTTSTGTTSGGTSGSSTGAGTSSGKGSTSSTSSAGSTSQGGSQAGVGGGGSSTKTGGSHSGTTSTGKASGTNKTKQHSAHHPGIYIDGKLVNQAPEIKVQNHLIMSLASVMWVLKKGDIASKWNGKDWHITLPLPMGVKWPKVPHGKGDVRVYINGHLVFMSDKTVVKHMGHTTTYLPIGAIIPVLRLMGLHVMWNGSELNVVEHTGL